VGQLVLDPERQATRAGERRQRAGDLVDNRAEPVTGGVAEHHADR